MSDYNNNDGSVGNRFWPVIGYIALIILGLLLGAALIYGFLCLGSTPVAEDVLPEIEEPEIPLIPDPPVKADVDTAYVAAKVLPAVVGVSQEFTIRWFGQESQEEFEIGSGVVISPDGYIVTNQHVVEDAQSISVIIPDKGRYEAELIGADSLTDVALLKIDEINLSYLEIGDSDSVRVGEKVLAVGNPLGLQQTVTSGIISATSREIRLPGTEYAYTFFQTDALINPGNSGGPLVNMQGEVIGINTAKVALTGVEGIGLSIPGNTVKRVITDLQEHGRVIRPHLGVIIDNWLDYQDQKPVMGVLIVDVDPDSAAGMAGLLPEDIITAINGQRVRYVAELFDRLFSYYPEDTVIISYFRDGVEAEVSLTLGERPGSMPSLIIIEEPEEDLEEPAIEEPEPEQDDEPTGDEVENNLSNEQE